MGKVSNALAMLKLLESGRKYSVGELAELLEVTPRMVKKYKSDLEIAGIFIDTISGKNGGYVYHHKTSYDISFDYADVDAVENMLEKTDPKEQAKVQLTLEKLRTIVIYSADEQRYSEIDKKELQDKFLIISEAIKKQETLEFKFHGKKRIFKPSYFTYYKDYIYITGLSLEEDDIKTLNLLGIKF